MSLLEEHKAERRARIQKAARTLVAERGYAGLTMRDLAEAARVSVPTLYNLFGSKDAILGAELQAVADMVAAALPPQGESFLQRGLATFEAGMRAIESDPAFFRAVMQMFFTSPETGEMRRRIEDAFIATLQANLSDAQKAGQLVPWVDPALVARTMYALHMSAFLAWGIGDIDFAAFKAWSMAGASHVLAGVTLGRYHDEVTALCRALQPALRPKAKEVPHAGSRSGD